MTAKDLVAIRTELDIAQERMANLLGVSFVSVNRWENGHAQPSGLVLDLYRALGAAIRRRPSRTRQMIAAGTDRGDRGRFLLHLFELAYAQAMPG